MNFSIQFCVNADSTEGTIVYSGPVPEQLLNATYSAINKLAPQVLMVALLKQQ